MMPPKPKTALNITTSAHKNHPPVPPCRLSCIQRCHRCSPPSPAIPPPSRRCPPLSPAVPSPPLFRPCCPVGGGFAAVTPVSPVLSVPSVISVFPRPPVKKRPDASRVWPLKKSYEKNNDFIISAYVCYLVRIFLFR